MFSIKRKLIFTLTIFLLFSVFISEAAATKWVYPFVVWKGYVYVISEEYVTEVDHKIGEVTTYSDMDQYPGNFSNVYKKGTNYYSIKGISTDESIAIQDINGYIKANREKKYTFVANDIQTSIDDHDNSFKGPLLLALTLAIIVLFFIVKKFKK